MPSKYAEILKILKKAKNVAIFMHINPDGDCIGSAIGLGTFLKNAGKNVSFFSPDLKTTDLIPQKFAFLPNFENFNVVTDPEFDLAIGVDVGDAGRMGDTALKSFVRIRNNIVIDHHEVHENFAQLTYRESNAASTTQIIYKIIKEYDESLIDSDVATLLFAGLVTDSGGFTFSNCTEETYKIGGELVAKGANNSEICDRLLKRCSRNVFELRNKILSKAQFFENGRIGIIVFRAEDFQSTQTTDADTTGISDFVRDIDGVDIAISMAEVGEKKFKISFRTTSKANAANCAKCFGGGGHARAAGCRAYGYFEDVFEKLISVAKDILKDD